MENIYGLENPSNLMIYNAMYFRKDKQKDIEDHLDIIYKDLKTNEVKLKTIFNPKMKIYTTKPEYRNYNYIKSFNYKDQVDEHEVSYKDIVFEIPKVLDDKKAKDYVRSCFSNKSYSSAKNVHKHKDVFASDFDIEDYTFIQWGLNYKNDLQKKSTSLFLDIETDVYAIEGFPEMGQCPVDLVTVIDPTDMVSHTFLLKTKDNPQIQPFLDDIDSFREELHEAFDDIYGVMDYRIYPYDNETELLTDIFKVINYLKRTFVFVWNMGFDMPYLIARMKKLGLDPKEVICHPDFVTKELYYVKDDLHFDRANKGDYLRCSSYSKYLCQMLSYGAIRKGSTISSYKLTDIGKTEIGDEKLDYGDEAGDSFKTFSRRNFRKYVMYNIKDVLLQVGIGDRTKDPDFIYHAATSTYTRYEKIFRQTVFLRNVAYVLYDSLGLVIGNNKNIEYGSRYSFTHENDEDEEDKADGALVSNPLKNGHHGEMIMGMPSKFIFSWVIDMDFKSMYPNIIITFNISDVSMIGKLIIGKRASDYYIENDFGLEAYDGGKDFVDNYLSDNTLMMGKKWFDLPSIMELDKELSMMDDEIEHVA